MSLYYADTSAMVKLIIHEAHSTAFATFYDETSGTQWISSALLRIEVARTVTRIHPELLPQANDLLGALAYFAIDDDVIDAAMKEPDPRLRALDAIHLVTARMLGESLVALVTYDDRLAAAARDAGLAIIAPRD